MPTVTRVLKLQSVKDCSEVARKLLLLQCLKLELEPDSQVGVLEKALIKDFFCDASDC